MPINFVHMQDVKSQEAEPTEQSAAILESEIKSMIWNWNGPKVKAGRQLIHQLIGFLNSTTH